MEVFHINPRQFGLIVGAYGIAAGVAAWRRGSFSTGSTRRARVLFLYFGFASAPVLRPRATIPCSWPRDFLPAPSAEWSARVILAIVGDVVPMERRGPPWA